MKIFQSRATLNTVLAFAALLVISPAAIGAIEPAKAAAKTPAALDENAIVKLNAKQKLPKIVKQLTIIDRDTGDKNDPAFEPVQKTFCLCDAEGIDKNSNHTDAEAVH